MDIVFYIFFLLGLLLWLLKRRKAKPIGFPEDGLLRRELGDTLESSMYEFHKYDNFTLANVIFIITREQISEETIRKALGRIHKRHPLMRSRIVGRDNNQLSYFEEIKDMETPLIKSESEDWKAEYETLVNYSYTEKDPSWKVVYMPNVKPDHTNKDFPYQTTLVFGFRHEMIDGTSYVKVFEQLLADISTLHSGDDEVVLSLPIPPSIEEVLAFDLKPTRGARFFTAIVDVIIQLPFIKYLFSSNQLPMNPWVEQFGAEIEKNPEISKRTCFLPTSLPEEDTKALLALCKKNDVTVQAAVQTVACIAMAQLLNDGRVPEFHMEKVGVTVNLRNFCNDFFKDHLHHVVPYFAPLVFDTKINNQWKTNFWQLAADTGALLKRDLGGEGVNQLKMFRIFKLLGKAGLSVIDMTKKSYGRFENNLSFTNLGNCNNLSNNANFAKIAARYGSSSEHSIGPIFANNLMTVSNQLFWTITYYQNITKTGTARKYADTIRDILDEILKYK